MESIFQHWHFSLGLILLVLIAASFYFLLSRFKWSKKAGYYFAGVTLMFLIVSSPLHYLGMNYFFSAHMIIHVVLLLICGPLIVYGFPKTAGRTQKEQLLNSISSILFNHPWIAWLCGISIMWFYHIPYIFNSSKELQIGNLDLFSFLQTFSLLLSGMIFSWPIIGPIKKYRTNEMTGIVYLFTACIACSALGLLLTFAPLDIYHQTLIINSNYMGIKNNFRSISPMMDQEMAGLIMWVPCCFIYVGGCMFLLNRWFKKKKVRTIMMEEDFLIESKY